MARFFPMPRGDRIYLLVVIITSIASFVPVARETHIAGMALLGWLMAALMVIAPAVALWRVLRERPSPEGGRHD